MYIVFEDAITGALMKFFLKGYNVVASKDTIADNTPGLDIVLDDGSLGDTLLFPGNNANAIGLAMQLASNEKATVLYLDVPIDNKDVHGLYEALGKWNSGHTGVQQVMVLPIPCMEYYIIKSLDNSTRVFKDCTDVLKAMNYEWYRSSRTYMNDKKILSFERFCKGVITGLGKDCIRIMNDPLGEYGRYYAKDCVCSSSDCGDSSDLSVDQKLLKLYKAMPCIPMGSKFSGNVRHLNYEDIKQVHKSLVKLHNDAVKKFRDVTVTDKEDMKYKNRLKNIAEII